MYDGECHKVQYIVSVIQHSVLNQQDHQ